MFTEEELRKIYQEALDELKEEERNKKKAEVKKKILDFNSLPWYKKILPYTIKIERIKQ